MTILECDHVLVSPTGGSFEGPTDEVLARIGRRRSVRYSVPSFLLVPDLLQTGDLIAIVPSRLVRGHESGLNCSSRRSTSRPLTLLRCGTRGPTRMSRIVGCARAWLKWLELCEGEIPTRKSNKISTRTQLVQREALVGKRGLSRC